jgi:hypothetical protein
MKISTGGRSPRHSLAFGISKADKLRIALAPLHLVVGGSLIVRFVSGARTPMVLVLGVSFVAFGLYRLALVRRGLKSTK